MKYVLAIIFYLWIISQPGFWSRLWNRRKLYWQDLKSEWKGK